MHVLPKEENRTCTRYTWRLCTRSKFLSDFHKTRCENFNWRLSHGRKFHSHSQE